MAAEGEIIMNKNILLDTDIGPDCDDAAALALTAIYTEKNDMRLLGVTHCTSCPWGVGAIRAILKWYGREDVAVGTLADRDLLDNEEATKYNRTLAMTLDEDERIAPDCMPLMRRLLAAQDDDSVDMIGIGPLRNMANLLTSPADEISPLTGRELIARKVRRLTLMAGEFTPGCDHAEWNVLMDIKSARTVAAEWPTEMVFCGFEVGFPVITLKEPNALNSKNPVRTAYKLHSEGKGRMSWDLCTVQQALCGRDDLYTLSGPGRIEIDEQGVTRWHADASGKHQFIKLAAAPDVVAHALEDDITAFDNAK